MTMRIALDLDEDKPVLYISELDLKVDAKEQLKGKTASYLFPSGEILGIKLAELGVNPDCVPIIVISNTEFDKKIGAQDDPDEGE